MSLTGIAAIIEDERTVARIIGTIYADWSGVSGPPGPPGTNGATWYEGHGAPAVGLGVLGDLYLDLDAGDVYLKLGGGWALSGNITGPIGPAGATGPAGPAGPIGPTGPAGSVWYAGSGAPAVGLGVDGDMYLDASNGDVYRKAGGAWAFLENITGPTGGIGPTGPTGPAGSQWLTGAGAPAVGIGVDGDMYLDTSSGDVYAKSAGAWTLVENITGPAGTAGATWHTGAGVPAAGLGTNGDLYLRTATGDVYLKTAGAWAIIENITGPTGATGPAGPTGPAGGGTIQHNGGAGVTEAALDLLDTASVEWVVTDDPGNARVKLQALAATSVKPNRALGYSLETFPVQLGLSALVLNAREMFLHIIPHEVGPGYQANGIAIAAEVASAGVAPTHCYLGLVDSAFNIVALTADLAATFGAGAPAKILYPFTAPYVVPAGTDGVFFLLLFLTGGWGTTSPTVLQLGSLDNTSSRAVPGFLRPRYFATVPPANLVVGQSLAAQTWIATSGNLLWMALYP